MSDLSPAVEFARQNSRRFLDELLDMLRIPSISTLPEHKADIERAARFVAEDLKRTGLENVEIIPTDGHPMVYADWLHAEGKPTVLCYGHYDVQPVDPVDEWETPPFEPHIRNENIYARGSSDDKGQVFMHMKALEALMKTGGGGLPVNVRVIVEGEEEIGGEGIEKFLKENAHRLACDAALVSDTHMFAPETPSLTIGLRGILYAELEARGPRVDRHSGSYGGASPNPIFALCQVIARLKNEEGRVMIPGFYDSVKAPSDAELASWKTLPFDEEEYRKEEVGSVELTGEPGYSVLYRTWARPTLEVHGMPGGFTGDGAKTVIPARGRAKISMRLVPDQDPDEIFRFFRNYVLSIVPKGIRMEVRKIHAAPPVVVGTDNRFVRAAADAMRGVYGKDTVMIRAGGSIPIVAAFGTHLKTPSILMGFGLPDDGAHGPNEKFNIPNFHKGIESVIGFLENLGQ